MKAIILAAGRGERMRPLTDHTPKPLLEVGGKPLIVWHIKKLQNAGFHPLIVNHAHLGAQIEVELSRRFSDIEILYSPEAEALETAGGIANALSLLGQEPFAAVNADVYSAYDYAQLAQAVEYLRDDAQTLAHLVLVDNPPQHPNGDFGLASESKISLDKNAGSPASSPRRGQVVLTGSKLTFSGIAAYRPELFDGIARGTVAPLAPLLRAQIANKRVTGEHYRGVWHDIGTPQRLAEINKLLAR